MAVHRGGFQERTHSVIQLDIEIIVDAVGSIVDTLDKRGLSANTLVVFVNDNGGPIYTGVQRNGPLKLLSIAFNAPFAETSPFLELESLQGE